MLDRMSGVTGLLIKLGARLVVFGLVLFVAARHSSKVEIRTKWLTPLIALVFAALNMGLYWAVGKLLGLATFGTLEIVLPLAVNAVLLLVTARLFQMLHRNPDRKPWFAISGAWVTLWLAIALTAGHGLVWLALDYLPTR